MKKYTIYLGCNDRTTKKQEYLTASIIGVVVSICGDCTITESKGYYTALDGVVTLEKTLVITLFDIDNNININKIIQRLGITLNQESILYEESEAMAQLEYIKHQKQNLKLVKG